MEWWAWLVPGSCFALEFFVIAFFLRWRFWRSFPLYSLCVVFVFLRDITLTATSSSSRAYYLVFWLSTPAEILLTILATMESFWRVLGSFRLLRPFRLVLPTAILGALGYSAWTGYRFPPIEATPAGAAIIQASVASQYVILSIAFLFFLLVALFRVPWRVHEHRLILGFGVASLAFAFGGALRAVFGSRAAALSQQAPPFGYLVALVIWLSAVIHPPAKDLRFSGPPVEILEGLKFQLRNLRSFVRKGAR